jgi:predicted component of type VI protein secretion system
LGEEAVYDIYPGDTIGRATSDGPRPSVSIKDPDSYISAVQVQFDSDGDDWSLRDRSLNGTWINRDDDWHRVLSPRGKERLIQQSDESEQELAALPAEMKLAVGDRIALVHPDYGVWFEFRGENQ